MEQKYFPQNMTMTSLTSHNKENKLEELEDLQIQDQFSGQLSSLREDLRTIFKGSLARSTLPSSSSVVTTLTTAIPQKIALQMDTNRLHKNKRESVSTKSTRYSLDYISRVSKSIDKNRITHRNRLALIKNRQSLGTSGSRKDDKSSNQSNLPVLTNIGGGPDEAAAQLVDSESVRVVTITPGTGPTLKNVRKENEPLSLCNVPDLIANKCDENSPVLTKAGKKLSDTGPSVSIDIFKNFNSTFARRVGLGAGSSQAIPIPIKHVNQVEPTPAQLTLPLPTCSSSCVKLDSRPQTISNSKAQGDMEIEILPETQVSPCIDQSNEIIDYVVPETETPSHRGPSQSPSSSLLASAITPQLAPLTNIITTNFVTNSSSSRIENPFVTAAGSTLHVDHVKNHKSKVKSQSVQNKMSKAQIKGIVILKGSGTQVPRTTRTTNVPKISNQKYAQYTKMKNLEKSSQKSSAPHPQSKGQQVKASSVNTVNRTLVKKVGIGMGKNLSTSASSAPLNHQRRSSRNLKTSSKKSVDKDEDDDIQILSVISRAPIRRGPVAVSKAPIRSGPVIVSIGIDRFSQPLPIETRNLVSENVEVTQPDAFYIEDDDNSNSAVGDPLANYCQDPLATSPTPPPPVLFMFNQRSLSAPESREESISTEVSRDLTNAKSVSLKEDSKLEAQKYVNYPQSNDEIQMIDVENEESQSAEVEIESENGLCDLCGSIVSRETWSDHVCEWLCNLCGIFFTGKTGKTALAVHQSICDVQLVQLQETERANVEKQDAADTDTDMLAALNFQSASLKTSLDILDETLLPLSSDREMTSEISSRRILPVRRRELPKRYKDDEEECSSDDCDDEDSVSELLDTLEGKRMDPTTSDEDGNSESDLSSSEESIENAETPVTKIINKYNCEICNKKFSSLILHAGHLILHVSQGPHNCDKCDCSFSRPMELHRHVIETHRDIHEPRIRR